MSIHTFFKSLTSTPTQRRAIRRGPPTSRLCLESLEVRIVPSGTGVDLGTLGGCARFVKRRTSTPRLRLSAGLSRPMGRNAAFLWRSSDGR